ncbi:Flp family type IVb pilin [Methylobacterium oryzihabitans]|uniref:Flp family type IVb pilin n=1 Tax=Methylobacterium oryzihabitans TaxID=2499852 RepID=A0A3S2V6B7_9HYPH|nr:hypothetical protein [Methylobacterium oryzihabitans]RVU16674.1 hypothetical protein EOE48_16510 [Methylobacterium oryzihabitans]
MPWTGPTSDRLHRFLADRAGATAVEYALVVALVFLAASVGMAAYGDAAARLYTELSAKVVSALRS